MSSERGGLHRLVKDAALWAMGLPWRIGFGALGALAPRPAQRWFSPGGLSVLVVAPHPDDEVAGCAGTILLHRAQGDRVTVAHATDGGRSRALGLARPEMVVRRRGEAEAAASLLDVELAWVGLPEGEWREVELAGELGRLLRATSPDVVYAPSRVDFHPEHVRVAHAVALALAEEEHLLVRAYQVQVPLSALLVNLIAETGKMAGAVRRALEVYGTQLGSLRRPLRLRRYTALRHRGGEAAEGFWELPSRVYVDLHRSGTGRRPTLRGLRQLPFLDPLAYAIGRAERLRLSRGAALSPAPKQPAP